MTLRENLLLPWAANKELVDSMLLSDQTGLCQSMANKTAANHGGENLGMYNRLHFTAPELVKRQLAKDKNRDLGAWGMFFGELLVRLMHGMDIVFNSAAGHQCICAASLVHLACDQVRLAAAATKYSEDAIKEALTCIEEDPSLATGFKTHKLAAAYHSSLVGTTTFLSEVVLTTLFKSGHAEMPERILWKKKAARLVAQKAGGAKVPKLSKEDSRAMIQRLASLTVGQRIQVETGEDGSLVGVVEQVIMALEPYDVDVRVRYGNDVVVERLGYWPWKLVR